MEMRVCSGLDSDNLLGKRNMVMTSPQKVFWQVNPVHQQCNPPVSHQTKASRGTQVVEHYSDDVVLKEVKDLLHNNRSITVFIIEGVTFARDRSYYTEAFLLKLKAAVSECGVKLVLDDSQQFGKVGRNFTCTHLYKRFRPHFVVIGKGLGMSMVVQMVENWTVEKAVANLSPDDPPPTVVLRQTMHNVRALSALSPGHHAGVEASILEHLGNVVFQGKKLITNGVSRCVSTVGGYVPTVKGGGLIWYILKQIHATLNAFTTSPSTYDTQYVRYNFPVDTVTSDLKLWFEPRLNSVCLPVDDNDDVSVPGHVDQASMYERRALELGCIGYGTLLQDWCTPIRMWELYSRLWAQYCGWAFPVSFFAHARSATRCIAGMALEMCKRVLEASGQREIDCIATTHTWDPKTQSADHMVGACNDNRTVYAVIVQYSAWSAVRNPQLKTQLHGIGVLLVIDIDEEFDPIAHSKLAHECDILVLSSPFPYVSIMIPLAARVPPRAVKVTFDTTPMWYVKILCAHWNTTEGTHLCQLLFDMVSRTTFVVHTSLLARSVGIMAPVLLQRARSSPDPM
jgi:hypothetical protein